jgi:hypothetical protein
MYKKFYLFIISSLNNTIYQKIHEKRKVLLKKYNIPYSVLINQTESNPTDNSISTYVPLKEDEILYPISGYSPYMSQKFLNAVKLYFRSFTSFNEVPTYIIRTNATTYIHYPKLIEYLSILPNEKVLAGPFFTPNSFIVGMIMIFSKDVLYNMLHDPNIFSKSIMNEPDDVTLSAIAKPYSNMIDMMPYFIYPNLAQSNGVYDLKAINPKIHNKWLFRIRNDNNERESDIINWDNLVDYYEKN